MTAWTVGAFIVALVVIGYLFGSFDGGLDFLVATLVAAGVAVLVGRWLRGGAAAETDPGAFDERATKRAVRRGIARTALTAVVWVVLALIAADIVSSAWQTRGDRPEHFGDVVRHGFFVSHPGFRRPHSWGCCNTYFRTVSTMFTTEPKTASPISQPVELDFELDLRGRLDDRDLNLPVTGLDAATPASEREMAKLDRLPDAVATATAELRRPLNITEFYALLDRNRIDSSFDRSVAVYLQSQHIGGGMNSGRYFDNRVSWPTPALAGFQAWVKSLRGSDDDVLDPLGVPSKDELERIAADPQIYGFVLDQATPAVLRAVAVDPAVRDVSVGDVAVNLAAAGS